MWQSRLHGGYGLLEHNNNSSLSYWLTLVSLISLFNVKNSLRIIIVRTKKFSNPSPLRIVGLYSLMMARINRFVRKEIKQQERTLLEDGNKEERRNIIEYVSKCLSTRLPEEANDTQKNTLLTLFSQCSSCYFFIFYICVWSPFSMKTIFFLYTPSSSHLNPPSLPNKFLLATPVPLNIWGRW